MFVLARWQGGTQPDLGEEDVHILKEISEKKKIKVQELTTAKKNSQTSNYKFRCQRDKNISLQNEYFLRTPEQNKQKTFNLTGQDTENN